jgi:hypothetical protein
VLLLASILASAAVLTALARPATAATHPQTSAPGQAHCSFAATLAFSPPLTNSGGGTNPTVVTGHLTGCAESDASVGGTHGKLSGTLGTSGSPVACPGQPTTSSPVDLSAVWSGDYFTHATTFKVGPSTLTASGEATTGGGTVGLTFPGTGNSATTTGSFARSSPDGWSASLSSTEASSTFDQACSSRGGVKKLKLTGTLTVGASYGFAGPRGMATDGTDVWVANYVDSGDSVTEFNASTGAWVRTIPGLPNPVAVAYGDGHLFVVGAFGGGLAELDAATGATIATLNGGSYGFDGLESEVSDGSHIWALNDGNNSVTELDATTGAWIQTLSGGSYGFDQPSSAVFDGSHIWVTNAAGDSVTELDAATGDLIQTLSGDPYRLKDPMSVAFDGSHLWVTNWSGNSVTEIDAGTGSWVQNLSGQPYGFGEPTSVASDGQHVWVANFGNDSVTEVDAATGDFIRNQVTSCNGYANIPFFAFFAGARIWLSTQASASHGTDCVVGFDPSTGGVSQVLQG